MSSNICEAVYFRWEKIQFNEGSTQGDPVAMVICATGVLSLLHLNKTSNEINERTKQLASANDFIDAG